MFQDSVKTNFKKSQYFVFYLKINIQFILKKCRASQYDVLSHISRNVEGSV